MSPFVCRMVKLFRVEQQEIALEEMQSGWDGALSLRLFNRDEVVVQSEAEQKLMEQGYLKKVVRNKKGGVDLHFDGQIPVRKMVPYQPPTDEEIQESHREFLANKGPLPLGPEPKPGSFEDIVFQNIYKCS